MSLTLPPVGTHRLLERLSPYAPDDFIAAICRRLAVASQKSSGTYTAAHATLSGRTLKTGQSRWFVGYKQNTLRWWLPTTHPSATLVPLESGLCHSTTRARGRDAAGRH